jgi:hypothetical protein
VGFYSSSKIFDLFTNASEFLTGVGFYSNSKFPDLKSETVAGRWNMSGASVILFNPSYPYNGDDGYNSQTYYFVLNKDGSAIIDTVVESTVGGGGLEPSGEAELGEDANEYNLKPIISNVIPLKAPGSWRFSPVGENNSVKITTDCGKELYLQFLQSGSGLSLGHTIHGLPIEYFRSEEAPMTNSKVLDSFAFFIL